MRTNGLLTLSKQPRRIDEVRRITPRVLIAIDVEDALGQWVELREAATDRAVEIAASCGTSPSRCPGRPR